METNAFGQAIRPLCFTRADDERLALGYPHMIELTDEPLDVKKAQKIAAKTAHDATVNIRRFPRAAAPHFVRGARAKEFQDWMQKAKPPDSAFADGSPVSKDEARELVGRALAVTGCVFLANQRTFFYVLEQLAGTETVADAILDGLEALPEKRITHEIGGPDRKTGGAAFLLGFLLLRVPPKSRATRTKRLRAFLDRAHVLCKKAKKTNWELVSELERVLDGWSAPSLTSGGYVYSSRYAFATDDLDRLRALLADKETIYDYGALDVRYVYLLGPEIIGAIGKRRPAKAGVPAMFEDLGMIKHPSIATLFLEYVGKPMAKDLPLKWFRAHAEWARPVLASMKNEKAKAILGQL